MKVKITKPTHVFVTQGEVEVSNAECHRLMMLGCCEIVKAKEVRIAQSEVKEVTKEVKETKETKKGKAVK